MLRALSIRPIALAFNDLAEHLRIPSRRDAGRSSALDLTVAVGTRTRWLARPAARTVSDRP
jgi:hypothetical protein